MQVDLGGKCELTGIATQGRGHTRDGIFEQWVTAYEVLFPPLLPPPASPSCYILLLPPPASPSCYSLLLPPPASPSCSPLLLHPPATSSCYPLVFSRCSIPPLISPFRFKLVWICNLSFARPTLLRALTVCTVDDERDGARRVDEQGRLARRQHRPAHSCRAQAQRMSRAFTSSLLLLPPPPPPPPPPPLPPPSPPSPPPPLPNRRAASHRSSLRPRLPQSLVRARQSPGRALREAPRPSASAG
eukprot:754794-Hanusia_phi.AAC.4